MAPVQTEDPHLCSLADDVFRFIGFFCRCYDGFLSRRTSSPVGNHQLISTLSAFLICKNPGSSPLFPRVELQQPLSPFSYNSARMLCIWGMETWFELNENVIFIFKRLTMVHSYGIVLWVLHTFTEAFMKIREGGGCCKPLLLQRKSTSSTLCVERQRHTFTYARSNLIWRG